MTTRRIQAIQNMTGVAVGVPPTGLPKFALCDPADLLVDEHYQRELSDRSMRLIRKIIAGFDWRRYKPPVVAEVNGQYHVIDGQHTAIAAVSHGGIKKIPVMIIDAAEISDRASAFVGQNRDRLAVTATQIYFAGVAGGDEDSLTVAQVCERAGVRVLRLPPNGDARTRYKPGDTQAITTIQRLVAKRFAAGARRVLEVCAQGNLAPITANAIKAVDCVLNDPEYKDEIKPDRLVQAIQDLGSVILERDAAIFAAGHNVHLWRAMAIVLFRRATRGQRKAA